MDSNQRAQSNIKNFSELNVKRNNNFIANDEQIGIDIFKIKDEFYKGKKYLAIKLPAKIENTNKAIELLGGTELINKKVINFQKICFCFIISLYLKFKKKILNPYYLTYLSLN